MSFRSEPLKLCQIIVQKDAAFSCLVELGQHALVQFKDLNHRMSVFQRTYVREVRRCTELERCIRYIEKEVIDGGAGNHIPPLDVSKTDISLQREIYDLETRLYELERDIRQFLQNEAQLKRNYNDLKQCKSVYEKVEAFFRVHIENTAKTELGNDFVEINDVGTPLTPLNEHQETPWFIAGTIDSQKQHSFERVLWRACRRTAFVRTAEIDNYFEDPDTGKLISKSVFIIFFNGRKLQDIVNRVCEGFNAKQYSCPKTSRERQLALADILIRLHDLNIVIQTTEKHKLELLRGAAFELPEWVRQVHLQKCIFHTLNYFTFDTSGNFSVAECWVWERKMDQVLQILQRGVEKSGSTIRPIMNALETDESHPTFNRTNKFIRVFQDTVDSYGIASYRELNPGTFDRVSIYRSSLMHNVSAPYTIITFPFLFAMMFGDMGHGALMCFAALYLILKEQQLGAMRINNEIVQMVFTGRYLIFLMGLFSIYTGFIYNDLFSKSVNVFGSSWVNSYNVTSLSRMEPEEKLMLWPEVSYPSGIPYPVGVDPAWNLAESNKLNFLNSMKMKASIIIGVSQMTFGVVLSYFNYKYFHSRVDVLFTFIPQMIFLGCIFVYLCLQIVGKWIIFNSAGGYNVFGYYYGGSHCAPSLLIGLINMFMFKRFNDGFMKPNSTTDEYPNCHLNKWYPHQANVEMALVIVAIMCIPVMLLFKPMLKAFRMNRRGYNIGKSSIRHINKSKNIHVHIDDEGKEAELVSSNVHDKLLGDVESNSADSKKNKTKTHEGIVPKKDHREMNMSDIVVHQAIHTIEFVLGCISHTASYLRLWALSLAHSQLSEVLWHMGMSPAFSASGTFASVFIFIAFFMFFLMTVIVLVVMEGLSAFMHALRLHWVEFQSKFYEGAGYPFVAFSLKSSLKKLCSESSFY